MVVKSEDFIYFLKEMEWRKKTSLLSNKDKLKNLKFIFNYIVNNCNNNRINEIIDQYPNKYYINEINKKMYINNNNKKEVCNDIIRYNNTSSNNIPIKEKKYLFKVIHIRKKTKRIQKKKFSEYNNEIRVLRNNKIVYLNSSLLNSYSTAKNIKVFNKKIFIKKSNRSSTYRGISKNGSQWQVLMMINKKKSYIGSFPSEELAARIYDILALQNKGFKARTNFKYNSNQIKKICEEKIDIKAKNVEEIIYKFIVWKFIIIKLLFLC